MTPKPHPLRCETCKREHTDHSCSCYPGWIRLSQSDKDLIEIIGCASHSITTSAEQVHFIAEMDRMSFDNAICLSGIEEGSRKEDFIKIMALANIGKKVNVTISVRT